MFLHYDEQPQYFLMKKLTMETDHVRGPKKRSYLEVFNQPQNRKKKKMLESKWV